jgi:hypothetical protein
MTERFTLISELGRGGMGVVWRARDEQSGQIVALKLLHTAYALDPDYVARFERELELAKRIHSAHVVQVLGHGVRDGAPYLALEYVDGPSLRERLASHGPYSWDETKALLAQVAQGLADAHAAGVVHRDIKPSNVLIGSDGVVKLADFGIAKGLDLTRVTRTSTLLGTPAYLAPEGPKNARSDLYSLGIIAYELLTGTVPFHGTTYQDVIVEHIRTAPDLSKLPAEARPIVGWLLQKKPTARPQSAADLIAALAGWQDVPALALAGPAAAAAAARPAPSAPLAHVPSRQNRRRMALTAAVAGLVLLVVAAAAAGWYLLSPAATPTPTAARGSVATNTVIATATAKLVPNAWMPVTPTSGLPSARACHFAAFDSARSQMYVFGGEGSGGSDLWRYDAGSNSWAQMSAVGAPGAGINRCARGVWDAARNQLLIWGFDVSLNKYQMWSFVPASSGTNGTWTLLSPTGTPFPSLGEAESVWDSTNSRFILYLCRGLADDVRYYDPASNSFGTATATGGVAPARIEASAAWDPIDQELLVFGGTGPAGYSDPYVNDLWAFSPSSGTWTRLAEGGSDIGVPTPRGGAAAAWDTTTGEFLIVDGKVDTYLSKTFVDDMWSFNVGSRTWHQRAPGGTHPPGRAYTSFAWDATTGSGWLFGGQAWSSSGYTLLNHLYRYQEASAPVASASASSLPVALGGASETPAPPAAPPSADLRLLLLVWVVGTLLGALCVIGLLVVARRS